MSDSYSEEDNFEQSNDEWEDLINDQSFMDFMDQSEWFVDSMLENEHFEKKMSQPTQRFWTMSLVM